MHTKIKEVGPTRKGKLVRNGATVYVRRTSRGSWKDVNSGVMEFSDNEVIVE